MHWKNINLCIYVCEYLLQVFGWLREEEGEGDSETT